jgi:hypothetical protein
MVCRSSLKSSRSGSITITLLKTNTSAPGKQNAIKLFKATYGNRMFLDSGSYNLQTSTGLR